jgi:hypothetical protein
MMAFRDVAIPLVYSAAGWRRLMTFDIFSRNICETLEAH